MKEVQEYYIKGNFITRERIRNTFFRNYITRNIVYTIQFIITLCLININYKINKSSKKYKYKICICAIFKDEAKYLDEWIRYHLVIGIDHFYLYNNNSDDEYLKVLKPYIEKKIVDLIDWPHKHSQMSAYEDCYKKNNNHTNWLAFIDLDEFICPIATDDIKPWLEQHNKYPGIAIYWKQFGSNGPGVRGQILSMPCRSDRLVRTWAY